MTKLRALLLPFTAVVVLAWAGLVLAQNSQGGSFLPGMDYIIGGQWTWRGTNSPWVIEGTTDDTFETTITFTQPTADRTITVANATGNVLLGNASTVAGLRAGRTALDGANPTSVTTGLSALASCTVIGERSSAPADEYVTFTVIRTTVAGRLDIYAWTTNGTDPTLTASVASDVVNYICVGTP